MYALIQTNVIKKGLTYDRKEVKCGARSDALRSESSVNRTYGFCLINTGTQEGQCVQYVIPFDVRYSLIHSG